MGTAGAALRFMACTHVDRSVDLLFLLFEHDILISREGNTDITFLMLSRPGAIAAQQSRMLGHAGGIDVKKRSARSRGRDEFEIADRIEGSDRFAAGLSG